MTKIVKIEFLVFIKCHICYRIDFEKQQQQLNNHNQGTTTRAINKWNGIVLPMN